MSEKVRSLNLTSGNMFTTTTTTTAAGGATAAAVGSNNATPTVTGATASHEMGGYALIGAPTLISSTFSSRTRSLTPPMTSGASADASPNNARHSTAGGSDTESSSDYAHGAVIAQLNFHLLPPSDGAVNMTATIVGGGAGADANSIMNSSQISAASNDSAAMQLSNSPAPLSAKSTGGGGNGKHLAAHSVAGKSCRFPKLEECAHFHYERVQLGPLTVSLVDDKSELLNSSIASQSIGGDIATNQSASNSNQANAVTGPSSLRSFSPSSCWFIIKVYPHRCDPFLVKRSFDNMKMLDEMLHRCVYDRKISGLKNLQELDFKSEEDVEYAVAKYLERFSNIASDSLTCGTILTWLQLDNKGHRLPLADGDTMRSINTPAVGAAYGVRRYQAQASDEISIEVGDMISVIDMPSPAESIWWRGKKSHLQKSHYEVGFFPQSCVATIGDKVPRHFPMPAPLVGQLDVSPTKPVLRKHGKLIAFFRSFILSRPSRRRLKQSGIYRERVFSCDLSEHLLNSGQEMPMVLKCCAEFIEAYGIVDGIYRLSGITSNIQRLRSAFDEERIPDLGNPEMKQDIHAVSSLLKMYFRELPNPLCTYQLYDNFVEAIQAKSESNERLRLMKETVLKLPPPHYRTLKYLSEHLNKISQHHTRTGMTDKNLAIVWAPNLLRSPALESGGVAALRGVGVQAVVTEYLIRNCHNIFDALEDSNVRLSYIATAGAALTNELRMDSLTDCESLLVEQREHDQSLTFVERPKSLSTGGPKLISLEEAQERHSRLDSFDMKQSIPINMVSSNPTNIGSYIEVGGGPSSLPDKYHTVLSVPRSWQKRKTHSWKSIFTRNPRGGSNGPHDMKTDPGAAGAEHSLPHHKEPTQVTFAEADSIITNAGKAGKALHKHEKPKSIELFETTRSYGGEMSKPMDICVRSSSIDSLRTAGHSRSVSHDSYFDLLQSPQRGHITTCPSRELSELGLNFDREEPEMRIFSESESLVSSPRVGKENIPPSSGATSRRIMRARPEEFSSQTNSVNPSPKKQPRLNLLLSPSSACGPANNWPQANAATDGGGGERCHEHTHLSSDESCCKRYKLEDQLSDIQYIDCGTPEHSNTNPQTLYTSVQVHQPPKSALSKSSLYSSTESTKKLHEPTVNTKASIYEKMFPQSGAAAIPAGASVGGSVHTRYSYPSAHLGDKQKDQQAVKERFSYPGSSVGSDRRYSAKDPVKMYVEEEVAKKQHQVNGQLEHAMHARNTPFNSTQAASGAKSKLPPQLPKGLPDLLRAKNRNSYCGGPNDQFNLLILRSSSAEIPKEAKSEMERSKLSVTPSSPVQSPRYSLLMGETSSENSSAVTTPQYDLEPLMITSAMSCMSGVSGASSNQQQHLLGVDASSCLGTSHESLGSNPTTNSNISTEKRDMHALKRELSLDLNPISTKMTIDHTDAGSTAVPLKQQLIPSPSNNSNFTDNTSQSVTPSEFGYQNLQRHSSMHSLLATEDNSPAYEDYENTPSNMVSPLGAQKQQPISPIKSTISITYNSKSPKEELAKPLFPALREKPKSKTTLLETSFDENTVYEQVKLFRNSVTEVNQLLNENRKSAVVGQLEHLQQIQEAIEQEQHDEKQQPSEAALESHEKEIPENGLAKGEDDHDIQMSETNSDSLESCSQEKLLYENVEMRKPHSVYENLLGEEMKERPVVDAKADSRPHAEEEEEVEEEEEEEELPEKLDTDSLDSVNSNANDKEPIEGSASSARKSPSNFSVKELATKFESSPVEQMPAFDFSIRNSIKKPTSSAITVAPALITPEIKTSQSSVSSGEQQSHKCTPTTNLKQKLTKSQQITRSLDENAFVREFGPKHLLDLAARSTQQLPDLTEVTCNRRKSFDFTRPKTLNPPKRLPGMPIAEELCMKSSGEKPPLKLDFVKERNFNHRHEDTAHCSENDYDSTELKITPTTENRISLIQHNVTPLPAADLNNSNLNVSSSSLKVLSGVKLDRERIDKIKEERRQQLTQKYRGESFKSRSKTDLNSTKDDVDKFHAESLRVKSKSRGDMHALQKDIDNRQDFERSTSICASSVVGGMHAVGSESTLNTQNFVTQQRVRSISDEKNQNCDVNNGLSTNATTLSTKAPINLPLKKSTHAHSGAGDANEDCGKRAPAAHGVRVGDQEEFSARATAQKFERKSFDYANGSGAAGSNGAGSNGGGIRERRHGGVGSAGSDTNTIGNALLSGSRSSLSSTREKISPQFSIRDVTAMFESRSQNQQ